jgi:hypothetical protein
VVTPTASGSRTPSRCGRRYAARSGDRSLSQRLKGKEQAVKQADAAVVAYTKEVSAAEARLGLLDRPAAAH